MKMMPTTLIIFLSLLVNLAIIHPIQAASQKTTFLHTLNSQIKGIRNHVALYGKCILGKCTVEERNHLEQTITRDIGIFLGSLALVTGTSFVLWKGVQTWKKLNQRVSTIIQNNPQLQKFIHVNEGNLSFNIFNTSEGKILKLAIPLSSDKLATLKQTDLYNLVEALRKTKQFSKILIALVIGDEVTVQEIKSNTTEWQPATFILNRSAILNWMMSPNIPN